MPPQDGSLQKPVKGNDDNNDGNNSPFRVSPSLPNSSVAFSSAFSWVHAKKATDNCGKLWRVHDKLYDLTTFIDKHPGGKFWLETTQGMDITENFESSHLNPGVEKILAKYYVRDAHSPRNARYTFHENGFFKTLKRKVWKVIQKVGSGPTRKMLLLQDGCVAVFLALLVASAYYHSFTLILAASVFLTFIIGMAHNFFHQKDNFRMYYFDLSPMSSTSWRVTHALSHHVFPNTRYDFEVMGYLPMIHWLPETSKSKMSKFQISMKVLIQFLTGFINMYIIALNEMKYGLRKPRWENFLIILELIVITLIAWDIFIGVSLWLTMILSSSTLFLFFANMSAHHHPEIYHTPDKFRDDPDWGLCQMDALRDKVEVTGSLFLVTIFFGDHSLHHLFPTIDHSKLPYLYPVFLETCKEFDIPHTWVTFEYMFYGMFQQMVVSTPNPNPPGYKEGEPKLVPKSVKRILKESGSDLNL